MIDNNLMLSDGQTPTNTGTTASTNVFDTQTATRQIGDGKRLEVSCMCTVTATSSGSATVQAVIQDSPDNSAWTTKVAGPSLAVANVVAGTEMLGVPLPTNLQRYIRVAYVIGTAALTAGTFNAFLLVDRQQNTARPSGFTVA
jgi:hypothetical protein